MLIRTKRQLLAVIYTAYVMLLLFFQCFIFLYFLLFYIKYYNLLNNLFLIFNKISIFTNNNLILIDMINIII